MLIENERFETYSEAAKCFGVSTEVIRQSFPRRHEDQFPLFVDGIGCRTFQEARSAFLLSSEKLDEIIMGSKEFNFQDGNHVISVPKPIQLVYDLKKMIGDKYNLEKGLINVITHSEMKYDIDVINEEILEQRGGDEGSSSDEED